MSGSFKLQKYNPKDPYQHMHKHTHLYFIPNKNTDYSLGFVDVRRFGSWSTNGFETLPSRSPCPVLHYEKFRANIINNIDLPLFKSTPICELLLNQKFFNGIGNYLRAEILYHAKIAPFTSSYKVLKDLPATFHPKSKPHQVHDVLWLCHYVPKMVIDKIIPPKSSREKIMLSSIGGDNKYYSEQFESFCQTYYQKQYAIDNHKRRIWYCNETQSRGTFKVPSQPKTKQVSPFKKRVIKEKLGGETTSKKKKKKNLKKKKKKKSQKSKEEEENQQHQKKRIIIIQRKKKKIKTFNKSKRRRRR